MTNQENLKQEQLREKFTQFQTLQQYIEQVEEHLTLLNKQYVDLEASKEALREFSGANLGTVLAPIANGVFIKAEAKDNQNLLINVGADTVVEKSVQQAIELFKERQKETTEKIGEIQQLLREFHQQAAQIYKEVEALQ